MSRGLGRVQREVLDALRPWSRRHRPAYSIRRLAAAIYGPTEPTETQLSTVRRAVRGLVAAGLVAVTDLGPHAIYYDHPPGRRLYSSTVAPPKRRASRRGQRPAPVQPRGALSGPEGLDVTFTAACTRCGADATWTHTWDDQYLMACPSCDG